MFLLGKMGTVLTVSSRIGEISEARCSPLSDGGMRGIGPVIMSTGSDGANPKGLTFYVKLFCEILFHLSL